MAMLDPEYYLSLRGGAGLGSFPVFLKRAASSNDEAAARLGRPEAARLVVAVEEQTSGRGRLGRKWLSPPRTNLAFSLAWPLPEGLSQPGIITLAAGAALAEAAKAACSITPSLKYPNDLLVNGKKAAGILTEVKSGGGGRFAIIGVGVNVNLPMEVMDGSLRQTATSFLAETGVKIRREELLARFMISLEPLLEMLAQGRTGDIMDIYRAKAGATLGREVKVSSGGEEFSGVAESFGGQGELIIRTPDGGTRTAVSGDVTFTGS